MNRRVSRDEAVDRHPDRAGLGGESPAPGDDAQIVGRNAERRTTASAVRPDRPARGHDMADDEAPRGEAVSEVQAEMAVVSDGATMVFVADFDDTSTAWEAYEALKSIEDGRHVAIDGVVVVKREADGTLEVQKSTDHSTRKGLTWGLVGGAALGILFPPTLIGSAAALGGAGAAVGKLRQLHHKSQLAERLEYAVAPGHSGIIAVVSDPAALEIRAARRSPNAIVEAAVDDVVARDIKALASEAEKA
jgi:uncharacterized membrane protein